APWQWLDVFVQPGEHKFRRAGINGRDVANLFGRGNETACRQGISRGVFYPQQGFKTPGVGVMLQRKNGLHFDAEARWGGAGFQLIKQAQEFAVLVQGVGALAVGDDMMRAAFGVPADRKSTRLNSSHVSISYAVFCLKKK